MRVLERTKKNQYNLRISMIMRYAVTNRKCEEEAKATKGVLCRGSYFEHSRVHQNP